MGKRPSMLAAVIAVLGAVAISSTAGSADRAGASFPGANGRIAYVGERGIYVTGSKGHSATKRLTGDRRTMPAWSPDGRRIAYSRYRDSDSDIYKMRANGTGKVLLTTGGRAAYFPTWSPSGKKIAFTRNSSGAHGPVTSSIYKMRSNGAGKRRVSPKGGPDASYPVWSPSGNRIAYVCDYFHRGSEICSIRPDGSHRRTLTDTPRQSKNSPDFSPDGKRIVFSAGRGGDRDIFTMDANGDHMHRISGGKAHNDILPAWSPDGSRIAFVRLGGGILKMHVDGSHKHRIVTSGSFPAWQPK